MREAVLTGTNNRFVSGGKLQEDRSTVRDISLSNPCHERNAEDPERVNGQYHTSYPNENVMTASDLFGPVCCMVPGPSRNRGKDDIWNTLLLLLLLLLFYLKTGDPKLGNERHSYPSYGSARKVLNELTFIINSPYMRVIWPSL